MAYNFPAGSSGINPLQNVVFVDDFILANVSLPLWKLAGSNSGTFNLPVASDSGHPGVLQLTTSTTTNGQSMASLGQIGSTTLGNFILGGGSIDLYFVIKLPTLSDGTNTYEISVGFGDSQNFSNTSYDNGVFFNYSSTINSGNWQGSTSSATTKSVLNTSTAVTTSWTTLRINVNAAATLCTFYVNGVSLGTINSNIPTTTVSPMFNIAKSASTGERFLNIDLVYITQALTAAR